MKTALLGVLALVPLAVAPAAAETLYEQDGVILEGSVRLAARAAATCVAAAEADEATKANAGQPLHVWRLDYGVYNGSGRELSDLTAHVRIESEWPPCSSWEGPEGRFGGPLEWAGSYKVLQRTGGLAVAGEARETVYVLAFHERQPRFANWQLDFAFGEATTELGTRQQSSTPRPPPEPEPPPEPKRLCDFGSDEWDKVTNCWYELASPPDCLVWKGLDEWIEDPKWTGECVDSLAAGTGSLIVLRDRSKEELTGAFRNGKKHGRWVERVHIDGRLHSTEEGPYVDGYRQGHWVRRSERVPGAVHGYVQQGPYVDGERHGQWTTRSTSGRVSTVRWVRGTVPR